MTDKQQMWSILQMIANAESIEELRSGKYGLSFEETLVMAYENIKIQAENCIENVDKPNE